MCRAGNVNQEGSTFAATGDGEALDDGCLPVGVTVGEDAQ
jgi:hypothetical protein